jgi:hypothetical protein
MGGPSSNSSDSSGGGGTYSAQLKTIQRKKKAVDFIKGGGITGAVVRGVAGAIEKGKAKAKDRKINDSYLGSSDYQGDVSKKPRSVDPRTGKDNDNDPNPKSIEQPKVKSQMNNSEVKSDLITATGPTDIEMANTTEMSEDEKLLARKRGKKTRTILSSVTGDNTAATLSKKTLLG